MITGLVSASGTVTASGAGKDEIKKTLGGVVNLQIDKGVLKKFSVLSKVFSILNVSQLFTLHLPDMASGGMPFDRIGGTFSFDRGALATKDCTLRSEAMNMVAVGKADLVGETMDLTLGIQPLQTIDKVVSKIPLLGWVLTDTDKRLITFTFAAKGPWKDPNVQAIPVREMAKEVLQIFKRVLQLPVKIITDTGDVL